MATLVPPTRLPALGSGDALAAAAVLGVSLGAHEGAAMWDALHGQSLWDVLSAAARTGGPASSAAAAFPAQDLHALGLVSKGGAVSSRRGSAPAVVQPPPTPMLHELADGGVGIGGGGPSTGGPVTLAPWDSSTVAQPYHTAADRTEGVAAMLVDGDAAVRMRAVLALGKLPPQLVENQLHALLRCLDDAAPSVRRRLALRPAPPRRRAALRPAPCAPPHTPRLGLGLGLLLTTTLAPHLVPLPRIPTALPGAHRDARRPRRAPRRAAAGAHGTGARAARPPRARRARGGGGRARHAAGLTADPGGARERCRGDGRPGRARPGARRNVSCCTA